MFDEHPKLSDAESNATDTVERQAVLTPQEALDFLANTIGLPIDNQGFFTAEPTASQLAFLREWHEETTVDSIEMPDQTVFTIKMILARALMPQRDAEGQPQYLFGKGAGIELALQGQVKNRTKAGGNVPFRTHSDMEIYAAKRDDYSEISSSERFLAVFGAQEIYPVGNTKGLRNLPPTLLHASAEEVDYFGLVFLIPNLELQFVDKFQRSSPSTEKKLRTNTDIEWLAATYTLDRERIHQVLNEYVIKPELAKLGSIEDEVDLTYITLSSKVSQTIARYMDESPEASAANIVGVVANDFILKQFAQKRGIREIYNLLDPDTGNLKMKELIFSALLDLEKSRQKQISDELMQKHEEVEEIFRRVENLQETLSPVQ
jgi:hypothetical protein